MWWKELIKEVKKVKRVDLGVVGIGEHVSERVGDILSRDSL